VKKGADRAASTAKENLHDCRGTAHFHETKLDAMRIRHVAVIAPDHRFELWQGEFLLHAAGGLPIRTRVIREPKCSELFLHHGKQLMRRRRRCERPKMMSHEHRRC